MDIAQKDRIAVKNFGPIREVNVELGDLTVLIGAQASGKSLFLQMIVLYTLNGLKFTMEMKDQ